MSLLQVTLVARDYDYLPPLATGDVNTDKVDLILICTFGASPRSHATERSPTCC